MHPEYATTLFENNIFYALSYIRKVGLETVEWIGTNNLDNYFYDKVFRDIYNTIWPTLFTSSYECKSAKIKLTESLTYPNRDFLTSLYAVSENIYQYVDKIDSKKMKSIEFTFNFYQKKLEKFLFTKYNININGRYISRAWIKMYELYSTVNYFDNISADTVRAFHVCEAPGNFINASIYYTENKTKIKKYEWNALSLKEGDIWDEYGFIKKTQDKWDFGKDCTGDITNHENLLYYYNKYKGVDSVVGDCGIPWSESDNDPTKNLDVYQFLYALLIPRKGGNFIIKTFAGNFNLQFLSFFYIAHSKYEKLHIFKSSRNIWSPEVYIVGIGNKGLTEEEENILLDVSKSMSKGKVVYPIDYINADCVLEHEYYTSIIIENYIKVKKFFVYLAQNYNFFREIKPRLENSLDKKNVKWLEKYMDHLENAGDSYKHYKLI